MLAGANFVLHSSDVTIDTGTGQITYHQTQSEPWRVTLVDTGSETMTGGRVKRVAESLGLEFSILLPDGGKQVVNACDQGVPLMEAARSNPLRKEIAKAAEAIIEADAAAQAKAAQSAG